MFDWYEELDVGLVVRKLINANFRFKVIQGFSFSRLEPPNSKFMKERSYRESRSLSRDCPSTRFQGYYADNTPVFITARDWIGPKRSSFVAFTGKSVWKLSQYESYPRGTTRIS